MRFSLFYCILNLGSYWCSLITLRVDQWTDRLLLVRLRSWQAYALAGVSENITDFVMNWGVFDECEEAGDVL